MKLRTLSGARLTDSMAAQAEADPELLSSPFGTSTRLPLWQRPVCLFADEDRLEEE